MLRSHASLTRRTALMGGLSAPAILRSSRAEALGPPNIVVIVSDDQPPSAFWNAMPKTRARTDLTWYPNAYCEGAECDPSRATLLTGLSNRHHGLQSNVQSPYFNHLTIAMLLQAAGYSTHLLGKYLQDFPNKHPLLYIPPGWTTWDGYIKTPTYYYGHFNDNGVEVNNPKALEYYDGVLLRALGQQVIMENASQPFFLWLATHADHQSIVAEPQYTTSYKKTPVPHTPSFNAVPQNGPAWLSALLALDPIKMDNTYRAICRATGTVDDCFVGLLQTLEDQGILENTIVVFLTDQGIAVGEHRWALKRTVYQEVVNTPIIVRWPARYGISPGINPQLVSYLDIAPTIVARTGATPSWSMDGIDFSNPALPPRAYAPIHWVGGSDSTKKNLTPGFDAVTDGRYKLVQLDSGMGQGQAEFYDLVADPAEMNNVIGSPAYAPQIARLQQALSASV